MVAMETEEIHDEDEEGGSRISVVQEREEIKDWQMSEGGSCQQRLVAVRSL